VSTLHLRCLCCSRENDPLAFKQICRAITWCVCWGGGGDTFILPIGALQICQARSFGIGGGGEEGRGKGGGGGGHLVGPGGAPQLLDGLVG
jgi:hypothetical protein